jgi:hypothetical protein
MTRGALMGLYWKAIGWAVLLFTGFLAYGALCAMLLASMSGSPVEEYFKGVVASRDLLAAIPLMVLIGVGYLALALALNVVMRVYLVRDLWARVIATTTVHNIAAAANVSARGELANALGEGFADGLDVAGF